MGKSATEGDDGQKRKSHPRLQMGNDKKDKQAFPHYTTGHDRPGQAWVKEGHWQSRLGTPCLQALHNHPAEIVHLCFCNAHYQFFKIGSSKVIGFITRT